MTTLRKNICISAYNTAHVDPITIYTFDLKLCLYIEVFKNTNPTVICICNKQA